MSGALIIPELLICNVIPTVGRNLNSCIGEISAEPENGKGKAF